MRKVLMIMVLMTLVAFTGYAQADMIFDGGTPNLLNGNEVTEWVQANDFELSSSATLTDVHFWTHEGYGTPYGGNEWDGTLEYFLFMDVGGAPDSSPFASGNGVNVVKAFEGAGPYDTNTFSYSFDLESPIYLTAGTTYWLGLHLASDYSYDGIFWASTDNSYGAFGLNGEESLGGTFDNWYNNGQDHAFYLTGQVPEPATLLLLGAGLAGVAACGRRFRKR